ncbi:MAG: hypothetical protein AABZ32_05825 [Bacteroidota bacterium]
MKHNHQKFIDVVNAAQDVLKNNSNPFQTAAKRKKTNSDGSFSKEQIIRTHCTRYICSDRKVKLHPEEFKQMVKTGLLEHLDNALEMYVKMYKSINGHWHKGSILKGSSFTEE